uniref:Uncharacterized protein n=1 Tax=Arundo donax TaxID=35708 RepID=A0A0A9GLJ3_ARUDO
MCLIFDLMPHELQLFKKSVFHCTTASLINGCIMDMKKLLSLVLS